MKIILLSVLLSFSILAIAAPKYSLAEETKLPLPRFVSIRSGEVNVRTGPGIRYPIKWVIVRKNLPVEIVAEFEDWRKIRDISNDEGWVHRAMLTGRRHAIIDAEKVEVKDKAKAGSKLVALANKGSILRINSCDEDYCEVEANDVDGYVKNKNLWGIYPDEVFEK